MIYSSWPGAPLNSLPILIIEDNKDHQLLVGYSLREQAPHVRPIFASNAHQALTHLRITCDEHNEFPTLVLLDLHAPELAQSWHAIKQIRSLYPQLPVLAFSSSTDQQIIKKAYELGANSFLTKPDTLEGWGYMFYDIVHYWLTTVTLAIPNC